MEWRCDFDDLPDEFYRVQYPASRAVLDFERGICAADTTTLIQNEQQLAYIVQQSFTWVSPFVNPMVNVFSEKDHAINWAYRYSRDNGGVECQVYTLDTDYMEDSTIFQLGELVDMLGINIPQVARVHEKAAYLCLHTLPLEAVSEVISCSQSGPWMPKECSEPLRSPHSDDETDGRAGYYDNDLFDEILEAAGFDLDTSNDDEFDEDEDEYDSDEDDDDDYDEDEDEDEYFQYSWNASQWAQQGYRSTVYV